MKFGYLLFILIIATSDFLCHGTPVLGLSRLKKPVAKAAPAGANVPEKIAFHSGQAAKHEEKAKGRFQSAKRKEAHANVAEIHRQAVAHLEPQYKPYKYGSK